MRKLLFLTVATVLTSLYASAQGYETTIPDEDHLDYFDLRGPVKEVRRYDYGGHSKTLWRFDKKGRLVHYENYETPFAGGTDSVSTGTRNYGKETIKLFGAADSKKVWYTLKVQCEVQVLDADVKTRRVYCRTNPNYWDYEENPQYYSVIGWMDEVLVGWMKSGHART